MISTVVSLMLAAGAPATLAKPETCALSQADREANAGLSFNDFDQAGTLASSARKLGERGCWKQAAEATADYLVRGPVPTPREQRILLFHLGQALALSGEEKRAADFIAATRAPPAEIKELNWNDYVVGTWAFLTKNRSALVKARDAVLATPGDGNRINGGILAGLERCFDKPYIVAYDANCGR